MIRIVDRGHNLAAVLLLGAMLLMLEGCSSMSRNAGPRTVNVPGEVREEFNLAMVAINNAEYEKAEEILSGVISQSQQTPVPQINIGMVRTKLGKLEEAEDAFNAALAIDPANPVASNELGLLYRKMGKFEEARQVYETVLRKYPRYPDANKNLGILCDLYLRDYACAFNAYKAYSAAVPDDDSAKIWIVDVQRRAGL